MGNPHPGRPCPGKLPVEVVPWDDGHAEVSERVDAVKRMSVEDQRALAAGWVPTDPVNEKGYPDP